MTTADLVRSAGRLFSPLMPATSAHLAERMAIQPRRRRPLPGDSAAEAVTLRFGLRALRWGDRGPALLALHGWEGRPQQFETLGRQLAGAGFQIFALTGPGHGASQDRQAHPGLFADAIHEAAAELGPLHGLIGHSMGAGAVLLAQLGGLRVERTVAVAGPAGYRGVLERVADQLGLARASRDRFLQGMEARTGLPLDQTGPAELLSRIDSRLLIVHDRNDPVVPYSDAETLARHGGDRARLLATRGLGHSRLLKDQTVIDAISDFLRA